MTKIKIVGLLVFIVSIALTILSSYISHENKINNKLLDTINAQKGFTQEISKNIFYIYRNHNASTDQLDHSIQNFIHNIEHKDEMIKPIDSVEIKIKSIVLLFYGMNFTLMSKTLEIKTNSSQHIQLYY